MVEALTALISLGEKAVGQTVGAAMLGGYIINAWNTRKIADANRAVQIEQAEKNRRLQYGQMELQNLISKRNCVEARRNLCTQLSYQFLEADKSRAFSQVENALNRAVQREITEINNETTRDEGRARRNLDAYMFYVRRLEERWPLLIDPMQFIEWPTDQKLAPEFDFQPLRVLVAPPKSSETENAALIRAINAATQGALQAFATECYRHADSERPVEFLDDAWNPTFHGGAAINTLFNVMRRTPTLILETQINGDFVDLSFTYWSGLTKRYNRAHIFRIDAPSLIASLCRKEAKEWFEKWKNECDLASEKHEKIPSSVFFPNDLVNQNAFLYADEKTRERKSRRHDSLDSLGLYRKYVLTKDAERDLQSCFGAVLCVYFGFYADLHHLVSRAAAPVLPSVFPTFQTELQKIPGGTPTREFLAEQYVAAYRTALEDAPSFIARIECANALAKLDRTKSEEELRAVVEAICDAIGIEKSGVLDRDVRRVCQNASLLTSDALSVKNGLNETLALLRADEKIMISSPK